MAGRKERVGMARKVSERYLRLRQGLVSRIEEGYLRPGDRFFSNRSLARQFGISYQTADRIVRDLQAMGLVIREAGSGTYVSGASRRPVKADLIFNERGKAAGSFGAFLLEQVTRELERRDLPFQVRLTRDPARLEARTYPVIWECPSTTDRLVHTGAFGLLLNAPPPPGLAARFMDGVAVDDFSGGLSAAQVLSRQWKCAKPAVLAGPRGDPRSERRLEGFRHLIPEVPVVHPRSWDLDDGVRAAPRVFALEPDGVFCANDRLAQAFIEASMEKERPLPRVIGFDNAPIAEPLNLTTIAIPWEEFIEEACLRIERRLRGDNGTARQVSLVPRILYRE